MRSPVFDVRCPVVLPFLLIGCLSPTFAQDLETPRPIRPLTLNQDRYRLRAGDRVQIAAPQETLDFLRSAKTRTVTVSGEQGRGFVIGPNITRDQVLLAASLTMKPGEYAVTVSAVGENREVRAAAVNITLDPMQTVPSDSTVPPVVLLNGLQLPSTPAEWLNFDTCPASWPSDTFGTLQTQLMTSQSALVGNPQYPGLHGAGVPVVYFFDNCVEDWNGLIEDLGNVLGQVINLIGYDNGTLVPQVDLIGHSMGGLIVRSYLAGLQANGNLSPPLNPRVRKFIEIATPNFGAFFAANWSDVIADGTQTAELIPGSTFLWRLGTWNQYGDDLRGVDALSIIGNAGYWQSSNFDFFPLNNESDGVVSLTSGSLNFARGVSQTRILPYCHIDSASGAGRVIDCTGKGGIANIDQAPETGEIVLSFLAGTSAWQSVGSSNQTQFGGSYFALGNSAGTQYTPFSRVLLGSQLLQTGRTNTFSYYEFLNTGAGTFTATSTANQTTTCGPFTVLGGTFSIFRCKFSPAISWVGPLMPSVAGWVVKAGEGITINGVGFGQQCSGCQAMAYPGPITLQVSSWSDGAITALLPSTFNGIAQVVVQATNGSDSITFMAASPPVLSVSSAHVGSFVQGQSLSAYNLSVRNAGAVAASGAVFVADTLPAGLTATAINGVGWACTLTALTCSRSDGLAVGATYPPITVTVSVGFNASSQVANQVSVSGGGSTLATANDPTTILPAFADVSPSDSFLPAIDLLMEYAITSGCGASPPMYCSTENVTEGQMAVFVVRSVMGGDNFTYTQTPYFSDVPPSYIFFPWIQKMQDLGIALPCGSNQFCPEALVTRGIMAVLIIRGRYGVATPSNYPATPYFTDVGINHPYFSWIQKMEQLGITSGCAPSSYCPNDPVTRGQMAVFLMRGEFNQLLPATTPVVAWASPASVSAGQTVVVTILGQNTNFSGVTQVNAGAGITVSSISVANGTTLTAQFAVAPGATLGPRSITVTTGGEDATLPNGLRVQ